MQEETNVKRMNRTGITADEAVSPVVGVMLMLVVVIIIAAVVAGFAGGLAGSDSSKNAPTLSMDVKVINMGSWTGSGFYATVTSVSKPIPTSDLKIVTSWTLANGTPGGATVLPQQANTELVIPPGYLSPHIFPPKNGYVTLTGWISPFGEGPGLDGSITHGGGGSNPKSDSNPYKFDKVDQQFGYYDLVPGTTLMARPYGCYNFNIDGTAGSSWDHGYGVKTPYTYTEGQTQYVTATSFTDAMRAMFGWGWENLQEGDKVNIKVIHIPTGKVIFNKDVPVTEG